VAPLFASAARTCSRFSESPYASRLAAGTVLASDHLKSIGDLRDAVREITAALKAIDDRIAYVYVRPPRSSGNAGGEGEFTS